MPAIDGSRIFHFTMTVFRFPSLVLTLGVAAFAGSPAHPADGPAPGDPDEALTLAQAVAEAMDHSPALRQIEADIDAARGEALTAKQKPAPELTFSPGIRRLSESEGSHTEFLGSLELTQTFLFPGKRELVISIAERNVELRKLAVEGLQFQVAAAVRKSYYELLAAQKIADLRRQQLQSAQTFLEATSKRVESGYASDFEAVKSRGDVINARKLLAAAEGDIAAARAGLNTLLGREPSRAVAVDGVLDAIAKSEIPGDLVAKALAGNPGLRLLAMQAEIAGMNLRKARLARKPDLTLGPSVEYSPSEQVIGVSATIPLLNRNYGRGEVLTAAAEQRRILADTERLRREIAGAVAQAAAQFESAQRQLALYSQEYLDQLEAVVAQAEHSYAQNVTSLLIYLDARRTHFDTLADYYEAIASVAASRAALESAAGVPLDSIPSLPNP